MKTKWLALIIVVVIMMGLPVALAIADDDKPLPRNASFSTLVATPLAIEGLTGDATDNLYTGGNSGTNCPVWRINIHKPILVLVGTLPGTCNPLGIAFDESGSLFVANGATGTIQTFIPNAANPPQATTFATGVPGANGLAFDKHGHLWVSDGVQNRGRVWKIAPTGGSCEPPFVGCVEAFRTQPMRNGTTLGGEITGDGVGRQARNFPPATSANALGGQDLVANGLAFDREGDLFVADTARGAIWQVKFDRHGKLRSRVDCDTTFTDNTLCLDDIWVAHPFLEGADGIALDRAGNIWVDANERNALVVVTKEERRVVEIFRNPVNAGGLRNSADTPAENNKILEFPTSPFLIGKVFCTANSDGDRRDNSPRAAGQIDAGGPVGARGKISCMDQELKIRGLTLPVD